MAEYINMTKRSAYIGDVFDALLGLGWAIQEAVEFCDKIRTADAVEVVRCEDCKHWDCGVCELHSEKPNQYNPGLEIEMFANDFCSYGERRDDHAAD